MFIEGLHNNFLFVKLPDFSCEIMGKFLLLYDKPIVLMWFKNILCMEIKIKLSLSRQLYIVVPKVLKKCDGLHN